MAIYKPKHSMIFKTFNSDIDNISSKWGLFGKSFYDVATNIEKRWNNVSKTLQSTNDYTLQNIANAWKMGNSNPIKFLADDEVISILGKYNKALDSGAEATAKFLNSGTGNEFMDGFLKDLNGAPATMDKYKVATNNATVAQKSFSASTIATKAAVLALNVAVSMGLSIVLGALIKTISEVVQSEENLKDSARELGSELSNTVSSIEDYKKKIEELKGVLSDNSSSFDDVTQARIDLMAIQDELIEKFGTEKGIIEDITEAIYGQTDALNELSRDSYYKAKNKFNEKTSGDKFTSGLSQWLSFGEVDEDKTLSNMDKMVNQMLSGVYQLKTTGNEVLDELIAKSYGLNIYNDTYGDGKHFSITGELDEIQEKIYGIQELASGFDVSTSFENSISEISNSVDSYLEANQNLYDQYVLWEKILTNSQDNQYDEQFNLVNQAKEAYDEALKSNDSNAIEKASENYAQTLSSAIALALSNGDKDVADYFEDMYPEMQQMFGEWKFSLNFEPNTDGLKDRVSDSLGILEGFSSEDIMAFNPNVATEEQITAYGELNNVASEYGLTLQGLINLLLQMELIQSESYQQMVAQFGQDNINKIAPEDLTYAYQIKNIGDMTFEELQAEIQRLKDETENANETQNSFSISETIDQLNTQLKPAFDSLSDAWNEIFTLDDNGKEVFSLDSVDSDMLSSIQYTISELNEIEGVSIDTSSYEDLAKILTDSSSSVDDVKKGFNALATSVVNGVTVTREFNDETKNLCIKLLNEMGILNAEEVVFESLNQAKLNQKIASMEFSDATADEIRELVAYGDQLGLTKEQVYGLYLQQLELNNDPLQTKNSILQLIGLCEAGSETANVLVNLYQIMTAISRGQQKLASGELIGAQAEVTEAEIEKLQKQMNDQINNMTSGVEVDWSGVKDDDKKKSSDKDTSKDTSKEFDWIERAVDNIEKQISRLNKVSDSAYSSFAEKNKALADQINLVNEEIQLQQKAYEGYMEKANSIGLSDDYKNLVQSGAINIEKITDKDLQEAISNYQEWYDKAKETQDKITDLHERSNDLRVEAADNGADELKELLAHQAITEREYLDRMNDLWEFYYENQAELAEVAKDKKLELLEEEKDYLEDVANAASSILDYEIDALEEQKENAIKPYQDQIDALEDKKKVLEDYLDDLEDERKHEELILNLQKAQYELEKARNQRTKLLYQDGQMTYVTDDKAVKDKSQDVDDAQFELTKFNIEQQIEAYDEQIDKLNELIDQTEKYYDNQIDGLEKTKNAWEKMIELQERAMNITLFESMFGKGSVADLLAGDLSQITTWQQEYVDTLANIDITANGKIGELTEQYAQLAGIDLSGVTSQTSTVASQFDTLKESVDGATSAIAGTSGGTTQNNPTGESPNGEEQAKEGESASANSLVGAIDASYTTASEKLPAEAEMMDGVTESTMLALEQVNELGSAIESLPSEKTITINIVTNGSVPSGISATPHAEGTVGKAFANGTHYKGLSQNEDLAIRSEYGQKELTVYPNGVAELTTEPTASPLPKDTVIFNEEQTDRILNNKGKIISAYTDGNAVIDNVNLPPYLRPLQEGDSGYELIKRFEAYQDKIGNQIVPHISAIDKNMELVSRNINNVNSNVNRPTYTINGGINVTCPAVTSKEVANQVGAEIEKRFFGLENNARQKMSITR